MNSMAIQKKPAAVVMVMSLISIFDSTLGA
jgi:hypothetical protein